jgi:transcriptional regulator with XRE-family HTH domain
MKTDFGTRLTQLRVARGETIPQVASALEMSRQAIWQWETGERDNPTLATVRKLARHFGVTVGYLADEEIEPGASILC